MRQRKKGQSQNKEKESTKTKEKKTLFSFCKYCGLIILVVFISIALINRILLSFEFEEIKKIGFPVSAGKYNLTVYCKGNIDSPKLIFIIPGATSAIYFYYNLIQKLSETTRTCSYDRPGRMNSGGSVSLDPKDYLIDLHYVIPEVSKGKELILVGHSLGGLLSVAYAITFPQEVKTLILLDSVPTSFDKENQIYNTLHSTIFAMKVFSTLGWVRIISLVSQTKASSEAALLSNYYRNEPSNIRIEELEAVYNIAQNVKEKILREKQLDIPINLIFCDDFGLGLGKEWRRFWENETLMKNLSKKKQSLKHFPTQLIYFPKMNLISQHQKFQCGSNNHFEYIHKMIFQKHFSLQ